MKLDLVKIRTKILKLTGFEFLEFHYSDFIGSDGGWFAKSPDGEHVLEMSIDDIGSGVWFGIIKHDGYELLDAQWIAIR